jgi:hypothetical protein
MMRNRTLWLLRPMLLPDASKEATPAFRAAAWQTAAAGDGGPVHSLAQPNVGNPEPAAPFLRM